MSNGGLQGLNNGNEKVSRPGELQFVFEPIPFASAMAVPREPPASLSLGRRFKEAGIREVLKGFVFGVLN